MTKLYIEHAQHSEVQEGNSQSDKPDANTKKQGNAYQL